MAATYDPALSSDKDWVRFLIGDTDMAKPILQDETIAALLAEFPGKYCASAMAGRSVLARGKGVVSKTVDSLSLSYGDSPESAYRAHLQDLQRRCADASYKRPAIFRTI